LDDRGEQWDDTLTIGIIYDNLMDDCLLIGVIYWDYLMNG
jgi:hypothetical protein